MIVFIIMLIGFSFVIERKAKTKPSGNAISKVSAKSFSVTPKPMHRSYNIPPKFIFIAPATMEDGNRVANDTKFIRLNYSSSAGTTIVSPAEPFSTMITQSVALVTNSS